MIEKCFLVAVVTVLMTAPSNKDGEEELRLLDMKWSCLKSNTKTHFKTSKGGKKITHGLQCKSTATGKVSHVAIL